MLVVKKFGGTSVGDKERIFACARKCVEEYMAGNDLIVVLSAMGKMTDDLIRRAENFNPDPPRREMDMLMTIGEQMSVSLFVMALDTMRIPAISLNAFQAGIHASSTYSNARIRSIDEERIRHELEARKIVVVTGFQGVNKYGDYVTLGRGGSDTSAVALAATFHADVCEIYTDVDGVYTSDPRIVKNARRLDEITYDEMLEMASLGAGVLHNRSVEMAKKYGVKLVVKSSFHDAQGTAIVQRKKNVEKTIISGVAVDKDTDRITVIGMRNEIGSEFHLFRLFAKENINIDLIIQSVVDDFRKNVTFTVDHKELNAVLALLEDAKETLGFQEVQYTTEMAKLSIVGSGIMTNPGVAAKMFETLSNEGINIGMITTSEIRITVLVKETDVVRAANAVHEAFNLAG
ncbi:MAG: aspartate kinase [Eubacterium sp.]|nr:aspartate kinase [Eubacterium sp.]